ncbi:MAG: DUF4388 domain-containing protein [Acidobacteriota bacterium]
MAVKGKLEDLSVKELLLTLSRLGKCGKLTLSRPGSNGLVAFRSGKVIFTASDSVRETLGNILACEGLLTESELHAALAAQSQGAPGRPLGVVLIELGLISPDDLVRAVRLQTAKVLSELLSWTGGQFQFEPVALPPGDEVEIDVEAFLGGLGGEMARAPEPPERQQSDSAASGLAGPPGALAHEGGLAALKTLMTEIRSPAFTGEITLKVMAFAASVVGRGVLFAVRHDGVSGMAQLGLDSPDASGVERARGLKLPLADGTVFARTVKTRKTFRGELPVGPEHDYLVAQIGGARPRDVVVIPMVVCGKVVALFYGDNVPSEAPIGPTDGLELLMIQLGLALEKTAIERRVTPASK